MPATFSVAIGGAFLYLTLGIPIGVAAARRRGTVADKALVSSFLFVSLHPLLPVRPADVAVPDHQLGDTRSSPTRGTSRSPRTRRSGSAGCSSPGWRWASSGARTYTRYSRGVDGRGAQRGLHPHRQGQGPAATTRWSTSTPCGPRWCRSSRSSASSSAPCSPARSSPRRIFDIDGIGLWSLQAVAQRDLPVVSATALFAAAVLIISNIVVDVIYSILDPRVRLS